MYQSLETHPFSVICLSNSTRGNGKSEDWLRPTLEKLIAAIEERMNERGLALSHQFQMAPNVPDNDRCMVDLSYCPVAKPIPEWNKTMCIPTCDWFSRDSLYSMPPDTTDFDNMNLPKDRVLVIVGVNHPLIGKSSFLNILCTGIKNPERPGHTPNFTSSHLAGSGELSGPLIYLSRCCCRMTNSVAYSLLSCPLLCFIIR